MSSKCCMFQNLRKCKTNLERDQSVFPLETSSAALCHPVESGGLQERGRRRRWRRWNELGVRQSIYASLRRQLAVPDRRCTQRRWGIWKFVCVVPWWQLVSEGLGDWESALAHGHCTGDSDTHWFKHNTHSLCWCWWRCKDQSTGRSWVEWSHLKLRPVEAVFTDCAVSALLSLFVSSAPPVIVECDVRSEESVPLDETGEAEADARSLGRWESLKSQWLSFTSLAQVRN